MDKPIKFTKRDVERGMRAFDKRVIQPAIKTMVQKQLDRIAQGLPPEKHARMWTAVRAALKYPHVRIKVE